MDARSGGESAPSGNVTTAGRKSDREMLVTRTVNGPARLVFQAFTRADLFQRWWVPKSVGLTLLSCELDVRVGGGYRLVFRHGDSGSMAFFGRYLEVVPNAKIVWTNEESGEAGAVTTATFEEVGGRTRVTILELYPSKEVLDAAIESGSTSGDMSEQFEQLDALLATLG